MRRIAAAALAVSLGTACAGTTSTTVASVAPGALVVTASSTTTTAPSTAPAATLTTTTLGGEPAVDMVPAGWAIEDFVPLVERYFAVRNWALEHPSEATEEFLSTVIEPGSVEMRDTKAEVQALLDEDAHYEGLSETFRLVEADFVRRQSTPGVSPTKVSITVEYGTTSIVSTSRAVISEDTLRRAPWTVSLEPTGDTGSWLIYEVLRNPFDHAPAP